jgi:hypothetical protein
MQVLLEQERQAEREESEAALRVVDGGGGGQALERRGLRLRNLVVSDVGVGLAGRTQVSTQRNSIAASRSPSNNLQVELCARGGNVEDSGPDCAV